MCSSDLRKLADVGQNVVVNELDCGTMRGITKGAVMQGDRFVVPLWQQIRGRTACDPIANLETPDAFANLGDIANAFVPGRRRVLRVAASLEGRKVPRADTACGHLDLDLSAAGFTYFDVDEIRASARRVAHALYLHGVPMPHSQMGCRR